MSLISLAGGSWWYEIWISLWLLICQGIYIFIGALYQVFEKVASVNLFSTDVFTEITSRIYIVMGIAMLFIFAYNLLLMIINPDEKKGSNNQMSKMVKETIISLTLLVLLPVIFNWMYIFQTHVLESNIIGQVILGDVGTTQGDYSKCASDDYECKCDFSQFDELEKYKGKVKIIFGLISWDYNQSYKKESLEKACKRYREDLTPSQRGAYSVSPTLLSAFYRPTNFNYNDCEDYLLTGSSSLITNDEDKQICINFYYDVNFSKYTGNISAFSNDSYLKDIISDFDKDSMEFQWLMATVAGVLAVYMFFCYAMEIGVRVAKLGFLQLISPIPVMMRIIPGQKEKIFDKWLSNLTNTYTDVFIRLIIIFFSLFAISLVPEVMSTLLRSTTQGDGNFLVKALASVFVILGILKFAGDAPALFKEFFGGTGNFALRSPAKQLTDNKLAMGGLGMAAGGLQNAMGNYYQATHDKDGNRDPNASRGKALASAAGGFFGGARRGAQHGAKAKDWDSFKHEMKQSKYETDRARKRRIDDKEIANKHGYDDSILQGFIGSQIRRGEALRDHIITDGSGKVEANAASGLYQKLEAIEGTFKNATIGDIENVQRELLNSVRGGKKDDVSFNGKDYKYQGEGRWTDNDNNSYNESDMMSRIKDYVTELKRNQYAENYSKNIGGLKAGMESMITGLKDSLSTLGKDFESNLFKNLNKIARENTDVLGNIQIDSVESLQGAINKAIENGDTRSLGVVYDLFDKVKSDTKAIKGETALRDSIEESKKSSSN